MYKHPTKSGIIWQENVGVEYLGESKIKFTCPLGHVTSENILVGPRGHKTPMNPVMVKKLAYYWKDRVSYRCKKCK